MALRPVVPLGWSVDAFGDTAGDTPLAAADVRLGFSHPRSGFGGSAPELSSPTGHGGPAADPQSAAHALARDSPQWHRRLESVWNAVDHSAAGDHLLVVCESDSLVVPIPLWLRAPSFSS